MRSANTHSMVLGGRGASFQTIAGLGVNHRYRLAVLSSKVAPTL